ncbi:hypothetical protein RchiOBHm_Chr7g0239441 [Rosa chinensis]|uniref:Uncharacterized protein n=1 Tax=Rosa chinensis TaxID=74649 RepID=A0A2P6PHT1_ROSCH|nr:hypothetical protein RchiOBHm_Chr7g0239441 [Rosa chinensis]
MPCLAARPHGGGGERAREDLESDSGFSRCKPNRGEGCVVMVSRSRLSAGEFGRWRCVDKRTGLASPLGDRGWDSTSAARNPDGVDRGQCWLAGLWSFCARSDLVHSDLIFAGSNLGWRVMRGESGVGGPPISLLYLRSELGRCRLWAGKGDGDATADRLAREVHARRKGRC